MDRDDDRFIGLLPFEGEAGAMDLEQPVLSPRQGRMLVAQRDLRLGVTQERIRIVGLGGDVGGRDVGSNREVFLKPVLGSRQGRRGGKAGVVRVAGPAHRSAPADFVTIFHAGDVGQTDFLAGIAEPRRLRSATLRRARRSRVTFSEVSIDINNRAASRAASRIATLKDYAASPPFRDRICPRIAREHIHSMGARAGYSSSRESGINN
jgi:hypothetical protein